MRNSTLLQHSSLRRNDVVRVRPPDEIQRTLDDRGTLEGLPFMPEMVAMCGKTFRVAALMERVCVEVSPGNIPVREFKKSKVVILDGLRCTGEAHGDCGRRCALFWKQEWIQKVDPDTPATEAGACENAFGKMNDLAHLPTRTEKGLYLCQSTMLQEATQQVSRQGKLSSCLREVRSGTRGPVEMLWLIGRALGTKIAHRMGWSNFPQGPSRKTPTESLNLQPGDWVEVKSMEEIVATLDTRGRNRGLQMDKLLGRYAGKRFRVNHRLDRMILESSGKMHEMQNTVMLEGTGCTCSFVVGGCRRSEPVYWREIWLKKIPASTDKNCA